MLSTDCDNIIMFYFIIIIVVLRICYHVTVFQVKFVLD